VWGSDQELALDVRTPIGHIPRHCQEDPPPPSHSLTHTHGLTLTLSHSLTLTLSLSHSLTLSLSHQELALDLGTPIGHIPRHCPPPLRDPGESGPLRAVHLSRHKWPGGVVNLDSGFSHLDTFTSSFDAVSRAAPGV